MHRKPIAITQSERGVGVAVVVFKDDKITDTKNTNQTVVARTTKPNSWLYSKHLKAYKTWTPMTKQYKFIQMAEQQWHPSKTGRVINDLLKKIRREVIELERQNWKIEFNWIKAHAGHQGNEMADELAKGAGTN